MKSSFQNLQVWNISFEYTIFIYQIVSKFPSEERYALSSQLKRSASSIPANIAEGKGRSSNKDFNRFLYIARGSLEESKSHLLLAKELGYINDTDFSKAVNIAKELGVKLNRFIIAITPES